MKILLIGGTGAMGNKLIDLLDKNRGGYEVYVTSRSFHKDFNNIHFLKGNAHENEFLFNVLSKGYDVIVDFLIYMDVNEFKDKINKILENTKHYIFLSSSRVYSNSNNIINEKTKRIYDELDNYKFVNEKSIEYAIIKSKEEDILKSTKKDNYTIIRPYITYDDQRLQLGVYEKEEWLFRVLKGKSLVISKDILNKITTLTNATDVAIQLEKIIKINKPCGDIYQIASEENMTWEKVLSIYVSTLEKLLNKKIKIKYVDSIYDIGFIRPNIQFEYDRNFDRFFSNKKLYEKTGINKYIKLEKGLTTCLKNFIEKPHFKHIDWGYEALKDKICGEKTKLKEIDTPKSKIKYLIYRYTNIVLLINKIKKKRRMKDLNF